MEVAFTKHLRMHLQVVNMVGTLLNEKCLFHYKMIKFKESNGALFRLKKTLMII